MKARAFTFRKPKTLCVAMPKEEEDALVARAVAGDEWALGQLYAQHKGILYEYAKRYVVMGAEIDDLAQEAFLGLVEALPKYDPSHGERFLTYAIYWIWSAVQKAAYLERGRGMKLLGTRSARAVFQRGARIELANASASEQAVAEKLQLSLEELRAGRERIAVRHVPIDVPDSPLLNLAGAAPSEDELVDQLDDAVQLRLVRNALRRAAPRDLDVLERHLHDESLEDIGKSYGISRERVRQLERRVLNMARAEVEKRQRPLDRKSA